MPAAAAATAAPAPAESMGDRAGTIAAGVAAAAAVVAAASRVPLVAGLQHGQWPYAVLHGPWMHAAPAAAVAAYLFMVHVLRPWYAAREGRAPELRGLLRAWNLGLCFMSVCILLGVAVPLAVHHASNGSTLHEMVCNPSGDRWSGPVLFWLLVMALSKYAELVDTVFLVLRKRPVNFLHWYHHATVLLYSVYAAASRYTPGFYFCAINAFVHSVMYWYYYRRACGVRLTYDRVITQVQLAQMVAGMLLSGAFAYYRLVAGLPCPTDMPLTMMLGGLAMYASYFVLFAAFYARRYRARKAKSG